MIDGKFCVRKAFCAVRRAADGIRLGASESRTRTRFRSRFKSESCTED